MKQSFLLILIIALSSFSVVAQDKLWNISGQVTTSSGEDLVNAIVLFRNCQDTSVLFPTYCNSEGRFYQELPKAKYEYKVSYLGSVYTPNNNRITVDSLTRLNLNITIELEARTLDEVQIIGSRPFVSYSGSGVTYNLSANPAAVGGNLYDGLKLIPGLQISENGGMTIYGFYKLDVAINGRTLRLSSNEIRVLLASMSTEEIKAVEVIRHPGPEYGNQVNTILNIQTTKTPLLGFNAFVSSDIVFRREVSENFRVKLNYNNTNIKTFLGYQFFNTKRYESITTSVGADTTHIAPHRGNSVQTGLEWQITPNQVFDVRLYGTKSNERLSYNQKTNSNLNRMSGSLYLFYSVNSERWHWKNNLDYSFSDDARHYELQNKVSSSHKESYNFIRFSSDYTYKLYSLWLYYGIAQNNIWFKNTQLSEQINLAKHYRENNSSTYLSLRYQSNSLDTRFGVQFNYDRRDTDWNGKDVFSEKIVHWQPYFNAFFDYAVHHRFGMTFQTYYLRPSLRDVMPYASNAGFLKRLGNGELKSSTKQTLSLNYSYKGVASLEFSFTNEKKPIIEYLLPYNSGVAISKTNLDNRKYFRVVAGLPIPILYRDKGIQWLATTYIAGQFQTEQGEINGKEYYSGFKAFYIQHKQNINLPTNIFFEAQITYYSPLNLGVFQMDQQWWLTLSASKRIKSWKFSVTAYDLFNSNIARGSVLGLEYPVSFTQNWHGPKFTFGVNYTFGNKDLKTSKRQVVSGHSRLSSSANEGINLGK